MNCTKKIIKVNGVRLYTAVQPGVPGTPPLLLINGLGANLEAFDPFVAALNQVSGGRIGTIRFDVPGVGRSPNTTCSYRLSGLTKLIDKMLAQMGNQKVDVLGISWGGGLAQQFARQYPHSCRRLILVATSTGSISVPCNPRSMAFLLNPYRYLRPSFMAKIAPKLYGGLFRQNSELIHSYIPLIRAPDIRGYYGQLSAGLGWTSIHWLHKISQSTLIMAGNDDPIIPLINARIMAWRIPNAKLYVINGGHLFLLAQAEKVAPIVHQFLARDAK